eukprot:scaffold20339_cov120-Isochrysis_galbana.AAC.5
MCVYVRTACYSTGPHARRLAVNTAIVHASRKLRLSGRRSPKPSMARAPARPTSLAPTKPLGPYGRAAGGGSPHQRLGGRPPEPSRAIPCSAYRAEVVRLGGSPPTPSLHTASPYYKQAHDNTERLKPYASAAAGGGGAASKAAMTSAGAWTNSSSTPSPE